MIGSKSTQNCYLTAFLEIPDVDTETDWQMNNICGCFYHVLDLMFAFKVKYIIWNVNNDKIQSRGEDFVM